MLERRHGGLWASGLERVRARGWIGIATVVEDAGRNVLGGGELFLVHPNNGRLSQGDVRLRSGGSGPLSAVVGQPQTLSANI
jgi:hypothetical protein